MHKILVLLLLTITFLFSSQMGVVHSLDSNGDGFLSIRIKPNSTEIGRLYNGNKVQILSKKGKYYKIKKISSGQVGYAHGKWIRKISTKSSSHTSTQSLNKEGVVYGLDPNGDGFLALRAKYKTGRRIGKLYEGDRVKILVKQGKWYKIKTVSAGQIGWVHGDWIKVKEDKKSNNKNNSVGNIANTDEEWRSIFKSYRKTIAKRYRELSLETLNEMAKSDALNKCKGYDERSKVKQLIKRMLMAEPLEFAKNRYSEYKNSMPTKEPKKWDKLVMYELVLDLQLSGDELELISKHNPGTVLDSMSYLDDCAYDNDCSNIASSLSTLHLPKDAKNISEAEFKVIDQMVIKFLERGCSYTLKKYSDCSDFSKNGCNGSSCYLLARIYSGNDNLIKNYKNTNKALSISQNMCYKKNQAESCRVLASTLVSKGTKFYSKAKFALQKGCNLTNNRNEESSNICLWCCDNYQDLIDKGW